MNADDAEDKHLQLLPLSKVASPQVKVAPGEIERETNGSVFPRLSSLDCARFTGLSVCQRAACLSGSVASGFPSQNLRHFRSTALGMRCPLASVMD